MFGSPELTEKAGHGDAYTGWSDWQIPGHLQASSLTLHGGLLSTDTPGIKQKVDCTSGP